MAGMTQLDQYRGYVQQWQRAGPALERFHAEELRRYRYDSADADAVLEMGDTHDGASRLTSGLVEMQRLFMKAAREQRLLADADRDDSDAQHPRNPTACPLVSR